MKKYWKILGIITLIAGVIYYPLLKLYLYLSKAKTEHSEKGEGDAHVKTFTSGYSGKNKPHRPFSHDGNPNATLV